MEDKKNLNFLSLLGLFNFIKYVVIIVFWLTASLKLEREEFLVLRGSEFKRPIVDRKKEWRLASFSDRGYKETERATWSGSGQFYLLWSLIIL